MSEKYLRVTMFDGSKWDVPAKFIAENRANYYVKEDASKRPMTLEQFAKAVAEEVEHCLSDDYEIKDWAENNMNWEDVKDVAVKAVTPPPITHGNAWVNGYKEVVER